MEMIADKHGYLPNLRMVMFQSSNNIPYGSMATV